MATRRSRLNAAVPSLNGTVSTLGAHCPSPQFGRRGRCGFSLVELLIVIAVIVILIALLLPAIGMGRAKARQAKCTSNQTQIFNAFTQAKTKIPSPFPSGAWPEKLRPYVEQQIEVYVCPDNMIPSSPSYGMNNRAWKMENQDTGRVFLLDFNAVESKVVGQTIAQLENSWPAERAPRHFQQQNVVFSGGHVGPKSPDAIDPRYCENYVKYWRPLRDAKIELLGCLLPDQSPTSGGGGGPGGESTGLGGGSAGASAGTSTASSTASAGTTTGSSSTSSGSVSGSTSTGSTSSSSTSTTGSTSTSTGTTTGSSPCSVGTAIVINDTEATYTGTWSSFFGAGYANDLRYFANGTGNNKVTYQFTGLSPGQYQVAASWLSAANRCSSTPYIISGGASPTTVNVNQQIAPNADWNAGGVNFQNLATVTITGTTITVQITDSGTGLHIADAVRITCTGGGLPPGTMCQGLRGEYRGDAVGFTGFPSEHYLVRVDPSLNLPFGKADAGSVWPSPSGLPYPFPNNRTDGDTDGDGVAQCLFTAVWTGEIKADFSETYTISGDVDDLLRVWINGVLVLDVGDCGGCLFSGTVAMTGNQWVPIRIEYANVRWRMDDFYLSWSSASQAETFISTPNLRTPCP